MSPAQADALRKAKELLSEHFERAVVIAEAEHPDRSGSVHIYPCGVDTESQEIGLIEVARLRVQENIRDMWHEDEE